MAIKPPEPLADHHDLSRFDSGVATLDNWLRIRARNNQMSGASRTYVLCDDDEVVGFYALSSGDIALARAPGRFRRNMPDPISVVVLGRLAVAQHRQGLGLGNDLFTDAVRRTVQAADIIGIRGLVVDALSLDAVNFYRAVGLEPSQASPLLLMATLADLRAGLS